MCTLFTLNTTWEPGISSLPENSGYKCPVGVPGPLPQCSKACHPHPVLPMMRPYHSLYLSSVSTIALTHLTLTKDYKVKFSRKESEETTVQRRMEHSWLMTTALRLGARTRARAACFLSPRCLSGTRKDLDISDHLFQSIC